jgi:hypothetical protein
VYDWPTHRISRWCRGVCTRARAALFDSLVAAIRAVDADTPLAMAPLGYGACDDWGRAGPAGSSALLQDRNVIYAVNSPCHLGNSNPGYGTAMECQTLHRQPSGWSDPVSSQAKFCLFSETPYFRVLRAAPPARTTLASGQRNFPNRRSGADWGDDC